MNNNHNDFLKLEIPVVIKLYFIYEITHRLIYKFPKHERYTVGEKIENSILESIEILIQANQASKYKKEKFLSKANAKVELLKILFRICHNCQIINIQQYLDIENRLQEVGKMIQGWIKYTRSIK